MKVNRIGRITLILFLTVLFLLLRCDLSGPSLARAARIDFPPTDYVIRSGNGAHAIGHAHFSLESGFDGLRTLHGEYRYLNGDSDIEDDTIRERPGPAMPIFVRSRHAFFNADGSIDRTGGADLPAGLGECTIYKDGVAHTTRAHLDFPPDTFAGASMIIPVRQYVMSGVVGHVAFHVFNCAPNPKVLKIALFIHRPESWRYYPGNLVEVGLKPNFGLLNLIIGPFLPEIRVWLDPSDDWSFVGGKSARYYKGITIMLVRDRHKASKSRPDGPQLGAGVASPEASPTLGTKLSEPPPAASGPWRAPAKP